MLPFEPVTVNIKHYMPKKLQHHTPSFRLAGVYKMIRLSPFLFALLLANSANAGFTLEFEGCCFDGLL